jgi:uncharacterized protein
MPEKFSLRVVHDIGEIDAKEWDKCLSDDHPFVRHAFLHALELSGSATAEMGWMPYHLILEEDDKIAAISPMYVKGHSQGEYVFDHSWANAYEQAGGRYYPKLQLSVPFSPVTGPRLLAPAGPDQKLKKRLLANGTQEIARKLGISSVHMTFTQDEDMEIAKDADFLLRTGEQFHWVNDSYTSFDDFLGKLSSRKRKGIKRERRVENFADLEFETLTGTEITEDHWDAFFQFYIDTGNRKWGTPYLTRPFFSLLSEMMPDPIVLFMVKQDGRYIAGALNLVSKDCLYGRYWGCVEDRNFLHFETCYYRAIDYAIANGINRVEAGAQGPHKLARGYLPVKTYSAHWMQDPGFQRAIADFLVAESRDMDAEISYLQKLSPFKTPSDE